MIGQLGSRVEESGTLRQGNVVRGDWVGVHSTFVEFDDGQTKEVPDSTLRLVEPPAKLNFPIRAAEPSAKINFPIKPEPTTQLEIAKRKPQPTPGPEEAMNRMIDRERPGTLGSNIDNPLMTAADRKRAEDADGVERSNAEEREKASIAKAKSDGLPDLTKLGFIALKRLGGGGQAQIYLVRRTLRSINDNFSFTRLKDGSNDFHGYSEDDVCVLKFLSKPKNAKALTRFYHEIKVASSLEHDGLIPILGQSTETDAEHFYLMQYDEGLSSILDLVEANNNPFHRNPLKALDAYIELLHILKYCHEQPNAVVHRDISHKNVMVAANGRIKLIDFGLCHTNGTEQLTVAGEAVGTFAFRPPECSGYDFSTPLPQADLYSAGKLLWYMVMSDWPYDREDKFFREQSLPERMKDIPTAWHLQRIFEKTIRHNVADRYSSTQAAIDAANDVRRVMVGNYPPLEALATQTCHVCGVGTYNAFTPEQDKHYQALIRGMGITSLYTDCPLLVCNYCAHQTWRSMPMLMDTIKQRREYR